jgi:hypothetical protein
MSKADLVEIIGQTSQIIGDELEHIHLNDKDKTPLASLSASTANLMVERYNVRDREPVMAAMLGMSDRLARVTKNEVYERLGAQARTAIEDVHRIWSCWPPPARCRARPAWPSCPGWSSWPSSSPARSQLAWSLQSSKYSFKLSCCM